MPGKKLTKQEIETIISLLKQGKKVQEIANMFGVSRSTIWRIKKKYLEGSAVSSSEKTEEKSKAKEESPIPPEFIPEPEEQPSSPPQKLVRGGQDPFAIILKALSAQEANLARARVTYLLDVGKHVVDNYEALAKEMGISVKDLVDRAIQFYLDWRDYIADLEEEYDRLREALKFIVKLVSPKLEYLTKLNFALRVITTMHAFHPVSPEVVNAILRLIFLGEEYGLRKNFERYFEEINRLGEKTRFNSNGTDKFNFEKLKGGRC